VVSAAETLRDRALRAAAEVVDPEIPVLTIADLGARVKDPARNARGVAVREVILGLNPDLEGDSTGLYVAQALEGTGVAVSRLARGLPSGSHIEFANRAALADAISHRQRL
jgi:recombination protein RecR